MATVKTKTGTTKEISAADQFLKKAQELEKLGLKARTDATTRDKYMKGFEEAMKIYDDAMASPMKLEQGKKIMEQKSKLEEQKKSLEKFYIEVSGLTNEKEAFSNQRELEPKEIGSIGMKTGEKTYYDPSGEFQAAQKLNYGFKAVIPSDIKIGDKAHMSWVLSYDTQTRKITATAQSPAGQQGYAGTFELMMHGNSEAFSLLKGQPYYTQIADAAGTKQVKIEVLDASFFVEQSGWYASEDSWVNMRVTVDGKESEKKLKYGDTLDVGGKEGIPAAGVLKFTGTTYAMVGETLKGDMRFHVLGKAQTGSENMKNGDTLTVGDLRIERGAHSIGYYGDKVYLKIYEKDQLVDYGYAYCDKTYEMSYTGNNYGKLYMGSWNDGTQSVPVTLDVQSVGGKDHATVGGANKFNLPGGVLEVKVSDTVPSVAGDRATVEMNYNNQRVFKGMLKAGENVELPDGSTFVFDALGYPTYTPGAAKMRQTVEELMRLGIGPRFDYTLLGGKGSVELQLLLQRTRSETTKSTGTETKTEYATNYSFKASQEFTKLLKAIIEGDPDKTTASVIGKFGEADPLGITITWNQFHMNATGWKEFREGTTVTVDKSITFGKKLGFNIALSASNTENSMEIKGVEEPKKWKESLVDACVSTKVYLGEVASKELYATISGSKTFNKVTKETKTDDIPYGTNLGLDLSTESKEGGSTVSLGLNATIADSRSLTAPDGYGLHFMWNVPFGGPKAKKE